MSLAVPAYAADKAIAKLTGFSGMVLIKSQGKWGVQPEKDLPLYSDDKVVTRTGVAVITFDDGAVMEIKANSNLLIRETEDAAALARGVSAVKRQVRLLMGKMFFKSGRSTSTNTTLETTTMVCGLRGTAGVLSIDAAGVTYLQFSEGGGDTIGNFIAGIAPDVPAELADLNAVQRAGFVAAAAADQANQVAEKLARGEVTDADAAFAAAKAAEAAALEAKAAAEAMLNNPDPEIRKEAKRAIKEAEKAIKEAREAQRMAIEAGAKGEITSEEGTEEEFGFDVSWVDTVQGNEFDIINVLPEEPPVETHSIGSFNAEIQDATILHRGEYTYTGEEYDSSYYRYEYTEDGSFGFSYYSAYRSSPYYNYYTYTYYYEDGTTYTYTYSNDMGTSEEGTWDRSSFDVSTLAAPPAQYGEDYTLYEYPDQQALGYSGVGLTGDLSVDGSMWGAQAQAGGVTLTAEGEVSEYQADSSIWYDEVYSNATYEAGGAYYGIFGGLKNGNILEAGMAAIGVAPNGTVGLLRGGGYLDPIAGAIASDNTFEMEGPLTWNPMGTIAGVTAANLMDNICTNDEGFFRLAATLGDTDIIGYGGYGYDWSSENFITASIVTSSESAPWGIYGGDTYGEYDTSNTATTWSGYVGGYGGFGVIFDQGYYNEMGEYPVDEGYYIGEATGTWSNGEINGSMTGSFLSKTKMGDMEGDIFGTYDPETGFWVVGSLGSWDGEDLTFASQDTYFSSLGTTKNYYASYSGSSGGSYYYSYYDDNTYGYTNYRETSSSYPLKTVYYYADGTTLIAEYDELGNYSETPGTWDQGRDLAEILTGLPDDQNTWTLSYAYDSFLYTAYMDGGSMGGTGSLWAGGAPVRLMGSYDDNGYNSSGVFTESYIESYNYTDYTDTTYDGGAYVGSIGGIAREDGSLADQLDARFIGIYIDPDQNAGILKGSMTGSGYEDLGIYELNGTIDSIVMEEGFGTAPEAMTYNGTNTDIIEGSGSSGGYNIYIDYLTTLEYSLTGADWGISQIESYGTYDEGIGSDGWIASVWSGGDREEWREIDGPQWSDGHISADIAGAWVDIADAQTGVSGGELMGIFDPNNLNWRVFGTEAWIETSKFLAMAATDEGRAKLAQLDIPCVQVGVVTLEGGYTSPVGGPEVWHVTMNDVEFFAYATGADPKIWATGDVQGIVNDTAYAGSVAGTTATLTGTDFNASFSMNNYDYTGTGNWDASVTGAGFVSYPVYIEGAAAGDDASDTGFSGTAAGTARVLE